MSLSGSHNCPLCFNMATPYHTDKTRAYFSCGTCALVFTPPDYFLPTDEEKRRYDLHENSPDDPRYRQFLSRLFIPMDTKLSNGAKGLDFGSGPGPTLSLMFEEAGYDMAIYDSFFADDHHVFETTYDFITSSEVVEHLHHPRRELDRLWQCLKPGGYLGIMTKRVSTPDAFVNWHYKNDLTHVCFFHDHTFQWLASEWNADLEFCGADVVIFHNSR